MYKIVPQEEKIRKETRLVDCKNIRFLPLEKNGSVSFIPLKHLLLQVIIEDDNKEQLKLKLSTSGGINNPKFFVEHPSMMVHPTITVGQGKNKRKIADVLSPKVKKLGLKEEYDLSGFEERLRSLAGTSLTATILQLFATSFAALSAK